jgi:SSS family solute:Na+ symporter
MDVIEREKEIKTWDELDASGRAVSIRPESLMPGQVFEKTYVLERKSIFWTKGIKQSEDGQLIGSGTMNLELVLLDKAGFDLTDNSHALNQTIRILIRTILPFCILIITSIFTKPDDKKRLDRFFVKMKTQVIKDKKADTKELAVSYANPGRFDHSKLFPNSNWEFDRWDKVDVIGFVLSVFITTGIIGLLFVLISIGR